MLELIGVPLNPKVLHVMGNCEVSSCYEIAEGGTTKLVTVK